MAQAAQAVARIPFTSAALRYREKIHSVPGFTLSAATQDKSPPGGAIKSYGYLRRLLLVVAGSGGGGGNLNPDAPWNFFSQISVTQPNGEEMYGGPTWTGFHALLAADHAGIRLNDTPDALPSFVGTSPNFQFVLPIHFEIDAEKGVGALPNQDFSAPWKLQLTVNTSTAVFQTAPTTNANYTIDVFMDCWTVPSPTNALNPNVQQEVAPPLLGTLSKWTIQQYSVTSGSLQNVLLSRKGNAIRNFVFVARGAANARVALSNFPNPFTVKWDGTVVRANDNPTLIVDDEYTTRGSVAGSVFAARTGVMALQMSDMTGIDAEGVAELFGMGAFWGTVQSSTLEVGGSWGASITVLEVVTNDVQFVDLAGNPYAFAYGGYLQAPAQVGARP
jgi:hypothetical protein